MSKRFNATVLVTDVSRKCTSFYGNPSYWVDFETKDYRLNKIGIRRGYTGSNTQCGFYCTPSLENKECWIEYHFTRKAA